MAEPLAETENKFRTFYHGTYPGRIEGILRAGLDPNYSGQGGGTLPGLNEKDPRPKIFLTTSPSYAKFYARMAAGMEAQAKAKEEGKGWFRQRLAQGTPSPPLRIDLPSDFKVNELASFLGTDEHYVTDLIPPEYIRAMNRLQKAASFGAMMGKMAGGVVDLGKGSYLYSDKERYEPGSNARFSLTWGEEHMKDFEDAIMDHVKQLNREEALRTPSNDPKYAIQEKDLEDYDKFINWLPTSAQDPHKEKLNLLRTSSEAMMGKSMGKSARVMIMAGNINNLEGAGKGALVGGGLGALGGALYGAMRPGRLNYESSGLDALETTGPEEHRRSYVDDKGNEKHYYVDDKGNVMMKRRGVLGGSVVHGLAGGLLGVLGGGMIGSFSPKSASFGAMMGKMAADPGAQGGSQLYGVPGIDDATSNQRFNLKANSPAEYARARNSYGDANSELYGLRPPAGFTEHNGSGVYSRDKTPKDRFNRDGSTKLNSQGRKDSVPASPWRSKPVSYKMDQFQNEKHYNEMANMNRANPPKDPNGVPAQRIAISNQQNSNAAQVLPYLAGKKFR